MIFIQHGPSWKPKTDEILKIFEDIIGKENCHQGRSLVTIFYIIV